jgi:hypothetical protein
MIQHKAVINKYETSKQYLQQDNAVSYGTSRRRSIQLKHNKKNSLYLFRTETAKFSAI